MRRAIGAGSRRGVREPKRRLPSDEPLQRKQRYHRRPRIAAGAPDGRSWRWCATRWSGEPDGPHRPGLEFRVARNGTHERAQLLRREGEAAGALQRRSHLRKSTLHAWTPDCEHRKHGGGTGARARVLSTRARARPLVSAARCSGDPAETKRSGVFAAQSSALTSLSSPPRERLSGARRSACPSVVCAPKRSTRPVPLRWLPSQIGTRCLLLRDGQVGVGMCVLCVLRVRACVCAGRVVGTRCLPLRNRHVGWRVGRQSEEPPQRIALLLMLHVTATPRHASPRHASLRAGG